MNTRERFLSCMNFQPVDRVHNWEHGLWGQTIDRWEEEGMPRDVHVGLTLWSGNEFFGIDRIGMLPVDLGYIPEFDVQVVEETERYLISWGRDGILTKALKQGTSHGRRASMDQYLQHPVVSRDDFESKITWRYRPDSIGRYSMWWDDVVRCLGERDYPLRAPQKGASNIGFYSRLRHWMGTEAACTVFYDDPAFAEEMLDFIADFIIKTLERALADIEVDWFNWFEDYAYKAGPLVSPKIFKRFLLPRYRKVNDFLRRNGINIILMDTDGNPSVLLPLMLEAGFTGFWPVECAAGLDPVKLRREYGHDLQMMGGIDKRVLAQDKKAIRAELLYKIPDLVADGGYLPGVDHSAPPDVPYENYMYYLELKSRLLAGETLGKVGGGG
jgi:hypothetical protein